MITAEILNYGIAGVGFFTIIYIVKDFLNSRKARDVLFSKSIMNKDALFTKTINNHFQHEMASWKAVASSQQKLADSIDKLSEIVKDKIK